MYIYNIIYVYISVTLLECKISLTVIGKDHLLLATCILNSIRQTGARHYFAPCVLLVDNTVLAIESGYIYFCVVRLRHIVN